MFEEQSIMGHDEGHLSCELSPIWTSIHRFSLLTLLKFLPRLIKFDVNPGKQQLTSGRMFIMKQPNEKNATKEAQSVWTLCLFTCPVFFFINA